jgi:GntR family transcriptional regulator, carbon starvation induced regulator
MLTLRTDVETKTLSGNAENALYEDIVSGRLSPGRKLRPEELRSRYNVGISPIREALLRLSSDGLVERMGQRGFRVPQASVEDLADITDMRCHLSCLALKRSIERGDFSWEAGVVAAFHQIEKVTALVAKDPAAHLDEWERLNRNFHRSLESACGSPWLLHFARVTYGQSERYRRFFVAYRALMPESQNEHRDILEAALARKTEEACGLLEHHIRKGVELVKDGIFKTFGTTLMGSIEPSRRLSARTHKITK